MKITEQQYINIVHYEILSSGSTSSVIKLRGQKSNPGLYNYDL